MITEPTPRADGLPWSAAAPRGARRRRRCVLGNTSGTNAAAAHANRNGLGRAVAWLRCAKSATWDRTRTFALNGGGAPHVLP